MHWGLDFLYMEGIDQTLREGVFDVMIGDRFARQMKERNKTGITGTDRNS